MNIKLSKLQTQKISSAQVQYLNFLKLTQCELDMEVALKLEENQFLVQSETESDDFSEVEQSSEEVFSYEDMDTYEEEYSAFETGINDSAIYSEKRDVFSNSQHFITSRESLIADISGKQLSAIEQKMAEYIVQSLDESGYLREDKDTVIDSFCFSNQCIVSEATFDNALEAVQSCEPYGIGARDLKECLMIQLFNKTKKTRADVEAYNLLDECYELFVNMKFADIQKKLGISSEMLADALKVIKKLQPKPVSLDAAMADRFIQNESDTDFIVYINHHGELVATLSKFYSKSLSLNTDLLDAHTAAKRCKKTKTKQHTFLANDAKLFLNSIKERESNMLSVINAIVALQHTYFATGEVNDLKSMTLNDVADMTGLDPATISRITSQKAVNAPTGKIMLKDLFIKGISSGSGEEKIANSVIKLKIAEIVSSEDKNAPLSDSELLKELTAMGYTIARRTVVKYREEQNIPAAKYRSQKVA